MRKIRIVAASGLIAWCSLIGITMSGAHADDTAPPAIRPEQETFFETKVRPLLSAECYTCHGDSLQSAGLRLDSRAALLKGGSHGPALVIAHPDQSPLLRVIRYDGAIKMPPTGKLKPEEIAALTAWVKMGAPWPAGHGAVGTARPPMIVTDVQRKMWPFAPFRKPTPPKVKNTAWCRTPIDRFILAKLEPKGMHPAPEADRHTLIRRVTYDLIGLPPTPAEVDAFVKDHAPDAYEKVVDRLLADPRYGERWGRHWLDVARYADSNGLDENKAFAYAFRYRDWVVRSFNQDLPYNQFITEQLAGDLMPTDDENVRNERITATGFLTLGAKVLAEQDKPKLVMDIVDEQIEVVSKACMGLTVACARCHDHKFDPIPTKDYYALAGIFKSTATMKNLDFVSEWNERPLTTRAMDIQNDLHDRRMATLKAATEQADRELQTEVRSHIPDYLLAASELARKPAPQGDQAAPTPDEQAFAKQHALRPTVLHQWTQEMRDAPKDPLLCLWAAYRGLPEAQFPAQARDVGAKAASYGPVDPLIAKAFAAFQPTSLRQTADRYAEVLIAVESGKDDESKRVSKLLEAPHSLFALPDRRVADYVAPYRAYVDAAQTAADRTPAAQVPLAMAVEDGKPENCKVHIRGSTLNLGDEVPRHFLTVLGGDSITAARDHSGRLELAQWLTRSDHPLTGRVAVNRIWQEHFGAGIVRTPDNFGLMGEKPTHPELLDWLASTFVEQGWSIKKLHRLILTSSVYRMSSTADEKSQLDDPDNRLFAHFNRRRLEAEPFRDAMLYVAGDLDHTIGGSLLDTSDSDYVTNDQSADAARYNSLRRSIYLPIIRNALFDMFQAFDYGDPSMVNAHRATTTVAPQALYVMNSPFALGQARTWATALTARGDLSDAQRIDLAYREAFARPATASEIARAVRYLIAYAASLPPAETDTTKRSMKAWESLCQVMFAANEFIYVS